MRPKVRAINICLIILAVHYVHPLDQYANILDRQNRMDVSEATLVSPVIITQGQIRGTTTTFHLVLFSFESSARQIMYISFSSTYTVMLRYYDTFLLNETCWTDKEQKQGCDLWPPPSPPAWKPRKLSEKPKEPKEPEIPEKPEIPGKPEELIIRRAMSPCTRFFWFFGFSGHRSEVLWVLWVFPDI